MNWIDLVGGIRFKTINNTLLLSDALIASLQVLGGRVPDSICTWLNRELTGYNARDLDYFKERKYDLELSTRKVVGMWVPDKKNNTLDDTPMGIESGMDQFLLVGMQDIEVLVAENVDINILRCGDENRINESLSASGFLKRRFRVCAPGMDGYTLIVTGATLIKIYRQVQMSLTLLLEMCPPLLIGKSQLVP